MGADGLYSALVKTQSGNGSGRSSVFDSH